MNDKEADRMKGFGKKKADIGELLKEVSDYRDFMEEDEDIELSEEELDFVAAARAVPDYQEFLRQVERRTKNKL